MNTAKSEEKTKIAETKDRGNNEYYEGKKTDIAETWDCGNNEYYEERRNNGYCGDLGLK